MTGGSVFSALRAPLGQMLEPNQARRQNAPGGKPPPKPAITVKPPKIPRGPSPALFRCAPAKYLKHRPTPLLHLTSKDSWCIEDALAGVHIMGANGSGKTSTSGQAFLTAYMRAGWGFLVMVGKQDEAKYIKRIAQKCGRANDIIHVGKDRWPRFNYLDYELHRPGDPAGRVENLVSTLLNLMEQQGRSSGEGESKFWMQAAEALLKNALMIIAAARSHFTLFDLQQFIDSIPYNEPPRPDSPFYAMLQDAKRSYSAARRLPDWDVLNNYFSNQFPRIADRTRSSITLTLATMMQDLLTGTARELFATGANFFPEDSFEGAIIILDLPAVENRSNITAQCLFKIVWQQAVLRRQGTKAAIRPVALWADEAHLFINSMDAKFQQLARSARAATVFLTQNLANYEAELGAQGPVVTRRLMGLFQTHVFHAQSDVSTIEHIIKLIGKTEVTRLNHTYSRTKGVNYSYGENASSSTSWSTSAQGDSHGGQTSSGWSESWGENQSASRGASTNTVAEEALFASHITALKDGSDRAGGRAGAFVFRAGRTWSTGSTALYTEFSRKIP